MEILSQIPEWLGAALIAAIFSVIGYFAKNILEWWNKQQESKLNRRARLEQLDRLLKESFNIFRSQRSLAQRLYESISQAQPSVIEKDRSLDQIFSNAYSKLDKNEKQLHSIIRGVTETAMRSVNVKMSDWLSTDDFFKQAKHDSDQLNNLAGELQQLELHLNEWNAKYLSIFEKDQSVALNYLADEQEQGTGFPTGIEALVKNVLKEKL